MDNPNHFNWRLIAIAVISIAVLWAVFASFVLPVLIKSIYQQTSIPSLNSLLSEPILQPVEHYLTKWNRIAWGMLPVLLLIVLIPIWPSGRYEIALVIAVLAIGVFVRLPGLFSRAIWDDEGISVLETAGNPVPAWPREPVRAGEAQKFYTGTAPLSKITEDLRRTDIHPPVYLWGLALWRRCFGFSLETARSFSLTCSIGTILALYLLLRAGEVERPLLPTLVYALSTCSVFFGSTARNYALATLFITLAALCGYLACQAARQNKAKAAGYSVAMAVCSGLAFQTHYFTLFPVGVILAWSCINLWREFRILAIVSPIVSACVGIVGLSTLLKQLSARPTQNMGFVGWLVEIKAMLRANLGVLWDPMYNNRLLDLMAVAGIPVLIGIAFFKIWIRRGEPNRTLWALLFGLAVAPSLGVLALDYLFNKQNTYSLYLLFGGPALAVLISYPIANFRSPWLRLGIFLVVMVMAMDGINWGFEEGPVVREQGDIRSLASTVKASSSSIVVIDQGWGRSNPASVVYELDPRTLIVCFGIGSDPEKLWATVQNYDDIWIVRSFDDATETINIWSKLVKRIEDSGYLRKTQNNKVTYFRKATAASRQSGLQHHLRLEASHT